MILINLLPHREERRKRRKAAFFAGLGVAAAAGLAVVGLWFVVVQQLTEAQAQRNEFLKTEIAKLEVQIKDIATLRAEIESLKARQKAVEDLQLDRNLPVHLLNELVKQTPEGIYYKSLRQESQSLSVNGIAQTQERISELLRNTANNSEWLVRPDLVESKSTSVGTTNRDQKRLYDFSMRLGMKRPQDQAAQAAAAASAPASAPTPARPAATAKKA